MTYFICNCDCNYGLIIVCAVVVLFAEKITTLRVLEAASRLGVGTRFVWIGSDTWSSTNHREFLNSGNYNRDQEMMVVLEGALAVQPLSRHLNGFDDYFTNLTLSHAEINPWFQELWQEYHECDKDSLVNHFFFSVSQHWNLN